MNYCFEFHISRKCRDLYKFTKKLFSITGNVIFTDQSAVKLFTHKVNTKKKSSFLMASKVNAMGLIDEILHFVLAQYQKERNQHAFKKALAHLKKRLADTDPIRTLASFVDLFPPSAFYEKKFSVDAHLKKSANQQACLEEILLLHLANENPAFAPYNEFFDDTELKKTDYQKILDKLYEFFNTQPTYGPYNQHIINMLKEPVKAAPDSLEGQLIYIKEHWGMILSPELRDRFVKRILISLDFIKEETKTRPGGTGAILPLDFVTAEPDQLHPRKEEERFTPDANWMPNVVMIAKHTYVWLDQLSKKYSREISKLNEIPDEELSLLASWGINGLWLIGLWERSSVSQKIKRQCGNPEALASAYSVFDYEIAGDLGGESAFNNLKERALKYGIRIGVDMVANHTGSFSRWIIDHPDWFIQSAHPPFPRYKFTGMDLSDDPRISIFIEDGYWNRSDAAVVFKLVDNRAGKIRYIYHGNDGTSTPWNDTAQLNFLLAEVREAVIQEILRIAHMSPLIRLDAAMTLTKKHFQRLWFPEPGSGGDIPSRAIYGMSQARFNHLFPKDFWREVVDRINAEVPDTLLLAEAFWLLEGYFVRVLGMHRVYNSAFMNMLKTEDNASYRTTIKNILDFNPEILKRFVNFMSNPDEQPAIEQFGTGDKYFGVAVMMATMPGLVMLGHGQIEGYGEKYGMEYRRAYWDEKPDQNLIERHQREIFPLLKKRYLFSGVEHFYLYDFREDSGKLLEDIFAYTNGIGQQKVLVVYNNKYQTIKGWIRDSVPYRVGNRLERRTLAQALGMNSDAAYFYSFRDFSNHLHYLRSGAEISQKGLYVELGAYKYHLFTDFVEIKDTTGDYALLLKKLGGKGVENIEKALRQLKLEPVLVPFQQLANKEMLMKMESYDNKLMLVERMFKLVAALKKHTGGTGNESEILSEFTNLWTLTINELDGSLIAWSSQLNIDRSLIRKIVFIWQLTHKLGMISGESDSQKDSLAFLDKFLFEDTIRQVLMDYGYNHIEVENLLLINRIFISAEKSLEEISATNLTNLFSDNYSQQFMHVHLYNGIRWFRKENFEELLNWLPVFLVVKSIERFPNDINKRVATIKQQNLSVSNLPKFAEQSGYQFDRLLEIIQKKIA